MNLLITVGNQKAKAILYDNATSKDFASLLPLELTLNDYANIEKVATLPKRLSTQDTPTGFDPSIGDLTYYAPWGNIALFYKDFGYADGLVSIGKITSNMELFNFKDSLKVKIELQH